MSAGSAGFNEIETLFVEAYGRQGDARAAYLREIETKDAALAAKLRALLSSTEATLAVLDRSSASPDSPRDETLAQNLALGAWRVIGLVGRGGMGEVYEVARADGAFELSAAAKLLKRGLDSEAIVRRFMQERRILARLQHANIARLLDAGVAPDGRPFLVMEYVAGLALTEDAQRRQLTIADRLRLLLTVCEAVQTAHDQGIVHRDLKPSNVLVTAEGQVKLLDFGIAKLTTDVEDADATRLAGEGMPLTPAYAAPEQFRGQPATPAADVYALGVMLYQLLTERLPHTRGVALAAVLAQLPEETVRRPSIALRQERGATSEVERIRRLRAVSADLDLIALKALHTDPDRRYADAGALAADLQRLLERRPIQARPDSLAYRSRRFVGRNRLMVAAIAAVMAALSAGLGLALWQAERARQAADGMAVALRQSEHVKDFMLSFINEQDRFHRKKSDAQTLEQLLAFAVARADRELGAEPQAHAAVLQALATIAVDSGDINVGRSALLRVLAENRQVYGPQSLQVGDTLAWLAEIEYFGERARSAAYAREALSIFKQLGQTRSVRMASIEARLGLLEGLEEAKPVEGEAHLRDALDIHLHQPTPNDEDIALVSFQLACLLRDEGLDNAAEPYLRDAIARIERALGANHIRLQAPLRDLAFLLAQAGDYEQALAAADRALVIARRNGAAVDARVADALRGKLQILTALHRYDEAAVLAREAQAAIPKGADAYLTQQRKAIALLDLATGHAEDAVKLVQPEVDTSGQSARRLSFDQAQLAMLLGRALSASGRTEEGLDLQRRTLDAAERAYGAEFTGLGPLLDPLADTLEDAGAFAEAQALRQRDLVLTEHALGRAHSLWARKALALAHNRLGQNDTARDAGTLPLMREAIERLRRNGPLEPALGAALLDLGTLQFQMGDRAAAEASWHEALQWFAADPGHPVRLMAQVRAKLSS